MTLFKRLIAMMALLTLAACGGGGDGGSPFGGPGAGGGSSGADGDAGSPTAAAADLVLTLSSSTITSTGGGAATATVTAVDANRNVVANVPVTFSVNNNAVVAATGTATGEDGTVNATVTIGSDPSNRTITVTAASGALTKSLPLQVSSSAVSGRAASLTVSLSSAEITSATPATVTLTLKDNQGSPLGNTVVNLGTARDTLASTAVASLLTNDSGIAITTLRSSGSGVQGADQLIATAAVGGGTVQGQASFNVLADSPTLSISPSSQDIRFSAGGGKVTVVARDAAGTAVSNALVTFDASSGLVSLNPGSVLTDSNGAASTIVMPLSPSSSGLDIVSASASIAGREQLSRATVNVIGEAPSLEVVSVSSSSISTTAPATFTVLAKDLLGNPLPNAVISFQSGSGLVTFSPATQATNGGGEATTIISPTAESSNGADLVSASVTVQGVSAGAQQLIQVTASTPTGTPTLSLSLDDTSISAASPATVTAILRDAQGNGIAGQVVTFAVARGLATTNVTTALTQSEAPNAGRAVVLLSPASATSAGADDISATVNYAGTTLTRSQGFQVQATAVTLDDLVADTSPLSAYGQTNLTLSLTGASVTSPVNISVTSSCVSLGKAILSPSSFTATSGTMNLQYRDNGCGALQSADQLQAVVTATGTTRSLSLPISAPADSSIAFVSATPEQIFLRGSGFTETSIVTFEVRDAAGNPLPNRVVELRLQTGAGGVTMEDRGVESVNPASSNPFTLTSNTQGRVAVRVNSGTLPTPVRVNARLQANTSIATVSSNLSVAVGLPSQLNFSLSQGTRNIEGYNIDGTPNTYQIIAADRSGNPVPAGTSINFVTEGGQIEAIRQTQIVGGIARTTANFVSSEPRPVDGRVTITAYALGEESFLDLNGDNAFNAGEQFQDLGNIYKDRYFDGTYSSAIDEFISLTINNGSTCSPITNPLLSLDASIPSVSSTCDGTWSGAGQVYVRRALETVLSTSGSRPLWPLTGDNRLLGSGTQIAPQTLANPDRPPVSYRRVASDTLCSAGAAGTFNILVSDANPGRPKAVFENPLTDYDQFPRLNPMAAGTSVTGSSATTGFSANTVAGTPVPSTTEPSQATLAYNFTDVAVNEGIVSIAFTSPSGTSTSASVRVVRGAAATAASCPP